MKKSFCLHFALKLHGMIFLGQLKVNPQCSIISDRGMNVSPASLATVSGLFKMGERGHCLTRENVIELQYTVSHLNPPDLKIKLLYAYHAYVLLL